MQNALLVPPLLALLSSGPAAVQRTELASRAHAHLERRMLTAEASEWLPVYAVLGDRLSHEHWFPRVQGMPVDERRALVMRDLKEHAARTQASFLARLDAHAAVGGVRGVRSNWLGNFVRFEATPAVLRGLVRAEGAALDGIEEFRFDASWPREAVADSVAAPAAARRLDGPTNTGAVEVWSLGITGAGVVVMNADSGINVQHGDLENRLWTNPGEIPGNGVDDDQNGFVDDVHGWNFFDDNDEIEDGGGHGTQTAGTLVGDGACSGTITGQAPGALVMTGALGPPTPQSGPFTPAGEVAQWDAIQYAIAMGAHVMTSSYSYKNDFQPPPNYRMHREVGDNSLAAGLIRTNSTGNNGALAGSPTSGNRVPFNVSTPGNLPPPWLDPGQTLVGHKGGVLGVGAHDLSNQLLGYSPAGPFAWHLDDVLAVNPAYPPAHWNPLHDDYPWFEGAQLGLLQPDLTGPTGTLTTAGAGASCSLQTQTGTSNATPRVAGTLVLWKSANPSLTPEDMAMIAHRTASESGSVPGKENGWGVGRVDALAGLHLALCVHRVNGEPAWTVDHTVGQTITVELDGPPNANAVLGVGTTRLPGPSHGGVLGLGGSVKRLWRGKTDANGEVRLAFKIPVGMAGSTLYTQGSLQDDQVTGHRLSSNVIATRFVP